MEKRGVKLGKAAYQELTGVKKPKLDEQGVLHWPVLLLYPEVMSSRIFRRLILCRPILMSYPSYIVKLHDAFFG
jgi:hypothetical protein